MDRQQLLETALRNAHAAGDVEAARALANEILKAQTPEPPPGAITHTESIGIGTPQEERAFAVEQEAKKQADKLKGIQSLTPALQGLGLQAGDEAVGAMAGGIDSVRGGNFADSYDINRRAVELANEREHAANPGRAFATEAVGSVGSALSLPMFAPFKGGQAAAYGNAAATGALYGGGIGLAGGQPGDRLEQAGKGAAIGGLAGPVGEGLISGGRALARPLMARIAPEQTAQTVMAKLLRRSGKSVGDVVDDMGAAAREGQGGVYMAADALGHPGQRMLSTLARTPGDARTGIVRALDDRQGTQSRRVFNQIEDAFGAGKTAKQTKKDLTKARNTQADAAYTAAADTAGLVNPGQAVRAIDEMLEGAKAGKTRKALLSAKKYITDKSGSSLDYEQLLTAKKDIGDLAFKAKGTNKGRVLDAVRRHLDEALEQGAPGYRQANDEFRKASKVIDAVDTGAEAGRRGRTEDIIPQFNALNEAEKSAYRVGYADPLLAKTERQAFGNNAARPFSNSAHNQQFQAIAGPNKGARLNSQLGRETLMNETRAQAVGGSRTADNLQDIAEFDTMPQTVAQLLMGGRIKDAAQAFAGKGISQLRGLTPEVSNKLAQDLTLTNSDAARRALVEILRKETNSRGVDNALIRALIAPGVGMSQ